MLTWLKRADVRSNPFEGNVRELMNLLRDFLLGKEPALQRGRSGADDAANSEIVPRAILDGACTLRQVEDWYMARVLDQTSHNYSQAARMLGVDRATLTRRRPIPNG